MPADFLPYAAPLQRGRPGPVTAIGVISIVVASLSLLYSLQQAVGAAGMMMVSRMSARMSATGAATTTSTVTSLGTTVTMTAPATAPGPMTVPASGSSGTGGTSTPAKPQAKPVFAPQMADAACIAVAAEGLLSLGLAVLLMVAGILTLRQGPKARPLHFIWAWSKIPLTLVGAAAYGWMMADFMASATGTTATGATGTVGWPVFFLMYAGFIVALGCSYPIGLLIALRAKSVRAYYNSIVVPAE